MNIEEYIVARINALLHAEDAHIVTRLEGGMSNYTYVVDCGGKRYTYRVPGKHAERFVNRTVEWHNIQQVEPLGLNNANTYLEIPSGEKLADYVEGTILSATDVVSYNDLSVRALRRLHESDIHFADYDSFGRLADDERYCTETGFAHPDAYHQLRHTLDSIHQQLEPITPVPCHCDYQPSNLIVNGGRLYVLDWEFAGMNDPIYDIACYGNMGFDKALLLLEAYVGRQPNTNELRRLHFHRAFQCMQWYNLAIFKERVGLSKELHIDFNEVAQYFLHSAADLLSHCH